MVFIIRGKTKTEVQQKLMEIQKGLEEKGKFDELIEIRYIPNLEEWRAVIQPYFHTKYPADYSKPEEGIGARR